MNNNTIKKVNSFIEKQITASHIFDWRVHFEETGKYIVEVIYLDILDRIEKMRAELIFSDDDKIIYSSTCLYVLMHTNREEWESTTTLPDENSFVVGGYEWVAYV